MANEDFYAQLNKTFREDQQGSTQLDLAPLPPGLGVHPLAVLVGNYSLTLRRMGVPADENILLTSEYNEQQTVMWCALWAQVHGLKGVSVRVIDEEDDDEE